MNFVFEVGTQFCFVNELQGRCSLLRQYSLFLANESLETRWEHKEIAPFQLQDDTASNVCLVCTSHNCLLRTSVVNFTCKDGCLFIHPSTQKLLAINQLSTAMCRLIREAEPKPTDSVQDVRKCAASQALAETMQSPEVLKAVN